MPNTKTEKLNFTSEAIELVTLSCPNCGKSLAPGATLCPNCNSVLQEEINLDKPKNANERRMSELVLRDHDNRGFMAALEAYVHQNVLDNQYNEDKLPYSDPNKAKVLSFKTAIGVWLSEKNEENFLNMNKDSLNPLTEVKRQVKELRKQYNQILIKGWPEYFKEKIAEFDNNIRNAVFDALNEYLEDSNKSISNEVLLGQMTSADKLIQALFCTKAIHDVKKIIEEHQREIKQKAKADYLKSQETIWQKIKGIFGIRSSQ